MPLDPRIAPLSRGNTDCPDDYMIQDRTREELANGDGFDEDYGEFEHDGSFDPNE